MKGVNNADHCFADNESSLLAKGKANTLMERVGVHTKVNINKCVHDKRGCWGWTQINRYPTARGAGDRGNDTGLVVSQEFHGGFMV